MPKFHLEKMLAQYQNADTPIQYFLDLKTNDPKNDAWSVNSALGKKINIEFSGDIQCIHCLRKIKKSFAQGYCFPCSRQLAACDFCILSPEKCHYHLGTCREPEWGLAHCFQEHIVYLSLTSQVKVGITRKLNIPTRFIDQGAISALPLFSVPSRYQAGIFETKIKSYVSDKTQFQTMLKNEFIAGDLKQAAQEIFQKEADWVKEYCLKQNLNSVQVLFEAKTLSFKYPVLQYPQKVKSINLDKQNKIEATLLGIKAQYLILDIGVINIRKYSGYNVEINF